MISRRFLKNIELSIIDHGPGWGQSIFRPAAWLTTAFFIASALMLGLVLAFLIASGRWPMAVALVFLLPVVIVFYKYPFAFFLLWLLATPFLQTTVTSQLRMLYWLVYRALPPLALCGVILINWLRQDKRVQFKFGLDGLAMLFFLGWVVVNIIWFHPSENLPYIYSLYDKSFVPFCVYWWIRFLAPGERDLKRLVPGAFFLVVFEVVVGVLAWLRPDLVPREWIGTRARTSGTLGFYTAYSLTLVFFSLLLFQAAMNQKSKIVQWAFLGAVGMGVVGVFLSFSRGCWLGGMAAGVGLLYLYPKFVMRLALILLLVMSVLGSTVLYKQITFAQERLNSENTAMVRFVIWDAGLQMIQIKPFFGWGYEDYRLYAGQFQRRVAGMVATNQEASHNSFISFAAELGLPGLLLYFFPAAWCLALTFKRWQHLPQTGFWSRKLLVIFWMMILTHGATSFFSDTRVSVYSLSLWWVTLGWIVVLLVPARPQERPTAAAL